MRVPLCKRGAMLGYALCEDESASGHFTDFVASLRFEGAVDVVDPEDKIWNWAPELRSKYSAARARLGLQGSTPDVPPPDTIKSNWQAAQSRFEAAIRRFAAAQRTMSSEAARFTPAGPTPQASDSQGHASSSASSSSAPQHPAAPASLTGQGPPLPQPPTPSSLSPSPASASALHHPAPPASPSGMGPREPRTLAPRCPPSAPGSDAPGSSAPRAPARHLRRLRVPAADDLGGEADELVLEEEEEGELQHVVWGGAGSLGPRARRFIRVEDEEEAGDEEEDDEALGKPPQLSDTESEEDAPTAPQPPPPPASQEDEDGLELDDTDDPLIPPPPPPQDDDDEDDDDEDDEDGARPDNGLFNKAIKQKLVGWLQAREVPLDVQDGLVARRFSLPGLFRLASTTASFIKTVREMGLPQGEAYTLLDKVKAEVSKRKKRDSWRKT